MRSTLTLLLACLVAVSLAACDQSSQNISFDPGENLTVTGSDDLTIPNYDSTTTEEYMIRAFSIEKDYGWSVSGVVSRMSGDPYNSNGIRRNGEVLGLRTSTPGAFTVTATTTVDGDEVSGIVDGSADYPDAVDQAAKYNLNVFASAVTNTGLIGELRSGLTAFAPSDAAFVALLDADGSGEIETEEMPPAGVLAQILRYHAATDSLRASAISDGMSVPTTLSGTFAGSQWSVPVSFSVNGGVTVNGTESRATKGSPDIATSEGIVMHKVDDVLLPSSVVSIRDQDVTRDSEANVDSVVVEGTYVHDGGFVALHEGTASGPVIGVSDYLAESTANTPAGGFHADIGIELNSQLSDTTTVVAMPHRDTDGNQTFTFTTAPGTDGPYTRGSTSVPVIDSASVAATAP